MSNTITQSQLNQIIGYGSLAIAAAILYGACCMVEDIINLGAQFRAYCDRLVEGSLYTEYRSNAIAGFVPAGLLESGSVASAPVEPVRFEAVGSDLVLPLLKVSGDEPEFELQNEGYAIYSVSADKQVIVWCGTAWGWQTYDKVGKGIIKHYKTVSAAKVQMKKLPESAYKSQAYSIKEFY